MTVDTAGPLRGFIGRWIMRFEASGQILSMAFQGTTAVSALSGVLAYSGSEGVVPYVLAGGAISAFVFAYVYTEWGLFNRKNREKVDYGSNFARPDMRIDDEMTGAAVFAAVHGRTPDEEEAAAIEDSVDEAFRKLRNGVDVK